MANQDAPLRPLSAKRFTSPPSSATTQAFSLASHTATPAQLYSASHIPSSPLHRTSDGECATSAVSYSNADSSNRDVCIDYGMISTKESNKIQSLRYVSESQPRLGSISVQCWKVSTEMDDSTMSLQYRICEDNPQVLTLVSNQATSSYLLPSPAMVTQDAQSAVRLQDHWQVKLQMAASIQRNAQEAPTPLSARILQKDLPTGFACNVCLKLVAETSTITQYRSLPSQHWEELVDAWMCHPTQEINQGMIDTQKKLDEHRGLQQDQVRVSDAGIIIHASHVATNAIVKEETSCVSTYSPSPS